MVRRLRIAVSVFFAALTLAVGGLWVRSYWWIDFAQFPTLSGRPLGVESANGQAAFGFYLAAGNRNAFGRSSFTIDPVTQRQLNNKATRSLDFKWYSGARIAGLLISYRLLAVFSGALALVPWMQWPRRFSLRTLFVAMTVIVLGLVVWFAG